MVVRPRLADVQCSRLQFSPGDRILVRSFHRLDRNARKRLEKIIQKWAGVEVEVLIYCTQDFSIAIEKR